MRKIKSFITFDSMFYQNHTYNSSAFFTEPCAGQPQIKQKFVQIFMSVDPLADKYPGISGYAYCANNPLKYVDPDGMEVEYNSFNDRLIVGLSRVFNSDFRQKFKTLKKSDETYVFNKNSKDKNSFTTDGNKLYINYSINENSKKAGQTIFSNLRHEATHADQFEHGELGFQSTDIGNGNHTWNAVSYDIQDEIQAHNAQNWGTTLKPLSGTSREWWNNENRTPLQKQESLMNTPAYSNLPSNSLNNPNTEKIKTDRFYLLPHKPRR